VSIDGSVISYIVRYEDLNSVQQHGVSRDFFVDEWRSIYNYILKVKRDHDTIPSMDTIRARYPEAELPKVRKSEFPLLISQIRQRRKYLSFLESLNDAASGLGGDFDQVDEAIQKLQGQLNTISYNSHQSNHLVDMFGKEVGLKFRRELAKRRRGQVVGIPTGFTRLDSIAGGLQKQKMVTIIGRSGLGKSWIDLAFVASAVLSGYSCILYPLEMSLFETSARLYTIFSQKMFGGSQTIKNFDITTGKVTNRKMVQFLNLLEDKFAGQLHVADVGNLSDPYTNERIEAEVEAHHPDMFWVDYITLLKAPSENRREDGHELVRKLSNGVKNTAMRRNVVGGASAQVNREAIKAGAWLPRLEHIAYGDAIGQDSDMVISVGKRGGDMWYSLVKHRGGPEIGKTRLRRDFNLGVLEEYQEQDEDDDDD
jgi:replicative DNA helicase